MQIFCPVKIQNQSSFRLMCFLHKIYVTHLLISMKEKAGKNKNQFIKISTKYTLSALLNLSSFQWKKKQKYF
jgi:hypothetical protein